MEKRTYGGTEVVQVVTGTIGYAGNSIQEIVLLENKGSDSDLRVLTETDGTVAERRFVSGDEAFAYFMPVVAKDNWWAYKHYKNGGTVCSDGRLCSEEDGDGEPDWLNKKYGIVSTENAVRACVAPFDSVQELLDAGANEHGVLWLKRLVGGAEYLVTVLNREDGTVRIDGSTYTLAELTAVFTFLNGLPCGKIGEV